MEGPAAKSLDTGLGVGPWPVHTLRGDSTPGGAMEAGVDPSQASLQAPLPLVSPGHLLWLSL